MTSVPLKRLAMVSYGLGQPPPASDDGIPIIRATNIHRGKIVEKGLIYAKLEDVPLQRAPLLKAGEILVVRSGAYTADSALVTEQWEGAAPGYDLRVTPSDSLEPRYLAYMLLSTHALDEMKLASSRAAQPHLNAEELGEVMISLFALERQRAIADYLDRETTRIDALLEGKNRLIRSILERRSATILNGVCGLLDYDGPTKASDLPWATRTRTYWRSAKINLVADLGTGHTPSRSRPELWKDSTIPWITTGEVQQVRDDRREVITETRERLSMVGIANSAAVVHPAQTVVLCRTASAGYSAIMGEPMATSQDFVTWTCSDRLLPRYLLMCLRAMRTDLLDRLAYGSTHKTIYWPDITSLKIPLPSLEEQREVLDRVDEDLRRLDVLVDRLVDQTPLLMERRQALITAAVTGQLEIPEAA